MTLCNSIDIIDAYQKQRSNKMEVIKIKPVNTNNLQRAQEIIWASKKHSKVVDITTNKGKLKYRYWKDHTGIQFLKY
jgi:hypothetical protein